MYNNDDGGGLIKCKQNNVFFSLAEIYYKTALENCVITSDTESASLLAALQEPQNY